MEANPLAFLDGKAETVEEFRATFASLESPPLEGLSILAPSSATPPPAHAWPIAPSRPVPEDGCHATAGNSNSSSGGSGGSASSSESGCAHHHHPPLPPLTPPNVDELLLQWKRDLELSGELYRRLPAPKETTAGRRRLAPVDDVDIDLRRAEVLAEGPTTGRLFASLDLASPALLDDNFVGSALECEADVDTECLVNRGDGDGSGASDDTADWDEPVEAFALDPSFDYERAPRTSLPDPSSLAAAFEERKARGDPPSL